MRLTHKTLLATAGLLSLAVVGVCGWLFLFKGQLHAPRKQRFEYTKQAEFDREGNIYVSSDQGKLIWMANTDHCLEASSAADQQTVGCAVKQDKTPDNFMSSVQLEIYRKGGHKEIIEPGAPIWEWHFWKDGEQVAIHSGPRNAPGTYALYDSATGRLVEKLAEPAEESLLPEWAKSRAEIEDESVPMSAGLREERTKWIAKLLRQIEKVKPGMRRRDLLKVFTTEGGISFPTERTYVHKECPYIKVGVRFKAVHEESNGFNESPDDIIESISKPYLEWSMAD
jgi:hypothetical protein